MWRQATSFPDALHRGEAGADDPSREAGGAGLVAEKPIDPFFHKACLPPPDRRLADSGCAQDSGCTQPIGGPQNDPGTPDVLLGAVAIIEDRPKALAINRAEVDGDACTHHTTLHNQLNVEIQKWTLMSVSIH
jgi:hypothetical protein